MEDQQAGRKAHVLLLYHVMIPSVRLCGHFQMEALAKQGRIEYRSCKIEWLTTRLCNWADVVILVRLDNDQDRELAESLHRSGRTLVYVLDDDLLNVPDELTNAVYYHQPNIRRNIAQMLAMSDAILSPSPLLLAKYAGPGQVGMLTEEPAISPAGYHPHDAGRPVRIGFAGSVDRTGDLERILGDALRQVRQQYGDRVEFEFFGAIPGFAKDWGAKLYPYCSSYELYRQLLNEREWDIGLAPMADSPFSACKHYNKFCEYAAAGIAGIFSEHEPYLRLKKKIGIGQFCQNDTDEWYRAISAWVENRSLLEETRRSAAEYAATKLSADYIAEELYRDYPQVWACCEEKTPIRYQHFKNASRAFANRVSASVKRHGWRFPLVMLKKAGVKLRYALLRR